MSTTFSEAPQDVVKLAKALSAEFYPDIVAADVTITFLMAHNGDSPALTKNGWPCKALVKINNLRDRVAGLSDVTLQIDEDGWKDWSEEHRRAVLDHELFHIEVRRNKAGAFKYDDANRPKLRLRPHDFELSGFHTIAKRYGVDSAECQGLSSVARVWKQMEFSWAK